MVNKINIYNPNGKTPSYSAFITYSNEKEASYAVLVIFNKIKYIIKFIYYFIYIGYRGIRITRENDKGKLWYH